MDLLWTCKQTEVDLQWTVMDLQWTVMDRNGPKGTGMDLQTVPKQPNLLNN